MTLQKNVSAKGEFIRQTITTARTPRPFKLTGKDIVDMAISMEKSDGPGQGAYVLKTWWPNLSKRAIDLILSGKLTIGTDNEVRIAKEV